MLRDAVLHLLADDPTLEPRDVIVMCPDIEHFAPLIEATFGVHDERDAGTKQLEIRLADRSLRRTNPLMGVLAEVLDLAGARMTATQVIDLAGREPVRRRFRFSDDDLARMEAWTRASHVSWGFDAEHREPFKLSGIAANTWRAGLDRALLGVAMADQDERLFGGTLPLDDVDSGDIELVGRMAEFVTRLRAAVDALDGQRTVDGWAEALAAIADSLTATSPPLTRGSVPSSPVCSRSSSTKRRRRMGRAGLSSAATTCGHSSPSDSRGDRRGRTSGPDI